MQSVIPRFETTPSVCTQVEQLVERGMLDQAEALALDYLETDSTCTEVLAHLASVRFVHGNLAKALESLNEARKLDPSNLSLVLLKAEILTASGDVDGAIDAAAIAATLFPDDPTVHGLMARLWMCKALSETGDERRNTLILADQYSSRAFELGTNDLGSHLEAASINLLQGNLYAAEDSLMLALAIDPFDPLATFLLGELAFSRKEWAKAEAYLSECALFPSPWKDEAEGLLKKVRTRGFRIEGRPKNLFYRGLVGLGGVFLACLLSVVPTLFVWIAVDSFTGYFPPVDLALVSVPIAPLIVLIVHQAIEIAKIAKSRRTIATGHLSSATQEYVLNPYNEVTKQLVA